jgi:hypothetical protein
MVYFVVGILAGILLTSKSEKCEVPQIHLSENLWIATRGITGMEGSEYWFFGF